MQRDSPAYAAYYEVFQRILKVASSLLQIYLAPSQFLRDFPLAPFISSRLKAKQNLLVEVFRGCLILRVGFEPIDFAVLSTLRLEQEARSLKSTINW